jgi:hypothetical protein
MSLISARSILLDSTFNLLATGTYLNFIANWKSQKSICLNKLYDKTLFLVPIWGSTYSIVVS